MATIIFDFDGTIADSFELGVDIFHQIMGRQDRITKQEVAKLRGLSARQVIKEIGVRWWRLPLLATRARKLMNERLNEVRPFEAMVPVIHQLDRQGHTILILSSNSAKNIDQFLKAGHLDGCFDKIYGNIGLFNKAGKLRQIMREGQLKPHQCLYVGDEVRDIIAARHADIPCAAVTWGFNNSRALREARPAALVRDPQELIEIVDKIIS